MMISVCGTKETEIYVFFECKCYDLVRRRWMRTWDKNIYIRYLGEVWTERQRNERNRVNVIIII